MQTSDTPEAVWRLTLVGKVQLTGPEGPVRLERRTAAVLAYLGASGETLKYRLAGWLWPDSGEDKARANMRQLLRRLRLAAGADLIEGSEKIRLSCAVSVDLTDLQLLAFRNEHAPILAVDGELLADLEFDDAPDYAEWLAGEREQLTQLRRHAASGEALRLERAGDLSGALACALRGVQLEPLSEDAHRQVIRLHYLMGDRGAALAAFERCRALLNETLGTEPMKETLALVSEVNRGSVLPRLAPRKVDIPLSVLKPPRLAGRERQWQVMEEAWQAGQIIFVSGPAGSGKTRLVTEFAASKGNFVRFEARPGDGAVPYATATRLVRDMLKRHPELQGRDRLDPWLRRELARVVPDLIQESAAPLASNDDKVRFLDALVELSRLACADVDVCILDDAQFSDSATTEFEAYLFSKAYPLGEVSGLQRWINVLRLEEVSDEARLIVRRLVDSNMAVIVNLEPLDVTAVTEMLRGLELPEMNDHLAERIAMYTGGNPLFVVETVKHLIESNLLARGLPERLPPPGRAGVVIEQRLTRLSVEALQVARAASVLQSDFTIEQVTAMLGSTTLAVAVAWEELERAQVMTGERFSHDLVYECVEAGIPSLVRRHLHERAANVLTGTRVSSLRLASHWLRGGRPDVAAPLFQQAAYEAAAFLQFRDVNVALQQAAAAFDEAGAPDRAFDALAEIIEGLWSYDLGEALEGVVEQLRARVVTVEQEARAWAARAKFLLDHYARPDEVEACALQGLTALPPPPHAFPRVRAELLRLLIDARVEQRNLKGAQDAIEQAQHAARDVQDTHYGAMLDVSIGRALSVLWSDERALRHLERAVATFESAKDRHYSSMAMFALAAQLEKFGQRERAAAVRRAVEANFTRGRQSTAIQYFNVLRLVANMTHQHEYQDALTTWDRARTLLRDLGRPEGLLYRTYADLLWALGDVDGTIEAGERALRNPDWADTGWGVAHLRLGQALARKGRIREAVSALDHAQAFLEGTGLTYATSRLLLARAELARTDVRYDLILKASTLAYDAGHRELVPIALAAQVEVLIDLGETQLALRTADEAVAALDLTLPREDNLTPWLAQHHARQVTEEADPSEPLAQAWRWQLRMLSERIPAAYKQHYLSTPASVTLQRLVQAPLAKAD
ncbi:ATP-binding protein [Deinococcus pimensis]|uniref:ATP-binding protein n=1 Tax=Deinococcus pimensis TaxID=309888 RepID=UPI000693925E|nr:AAA family ATPase [Deinococcus pimensis]